MTEATGWAINGLFSSFVCGLMVALLAHKGMDWIAVTLLALNAASAVYAVKNVAKSQREAA